MGNGLTLNGVGGRAKGNDDGSLDIHDWILKLGLSLLMFLLEVIIALATEMAMKRTMNYLFTLTVLINYKCAVVVNCFVHHYRNFCRR